MANIIFISFRTINFLPNFAIKIKALFSYFSSYLKFLIKSKNHHGIHSPFVYNFITKCLYTKISSDNSQIKAIRENRYSLLLNHNKINVTDFGAGSKVFKSEIRSISKIAKNAGISNKRGKLLYKIVQYFMFEQILEIGTSLGIATTYLSLASSKAKVITLEGCHETAKVAKDQFIKMNLKNITTTIGDFKITLPKTICDKKFDLIYFDGNHQRDATINYFEQCLSTIHNETIFIFDDIHWSRQMEQAWDHIIKHPKVTISIDTFQWGIVFFRKEQPKEHFFLRL
jgi:predicted O-methyltransferase YrrM